LRAGCKTTLSLRKKEHSFILDIAKQCEGNGGSQISKEAVLRALIKVLQHLDVNVSGVKTEEQLLQRIRDAV